MSRVEIDDDVREQIDNMSPREREAFLREVEGNSSSSPTRETAPTQDSSGLLSGVIGAASSASLPSTVTGSGGALEALEIGSGLAEGPLTAGQANLVGLADGAGVVTAGVNAVDALSNIASDSRRGKGAVEGVSTLGGTIGGAILGGPLGAGVGSVVGRTLGRGLASAGESLGFIGQPSGDEIMQDRINSLLEKGISLPDNLQQNVSDYGASKEQLVDRAKASQEEGQWGNPQFAESRDEADLQSEDIWGSLPMYEIHGDDWLGSYTPKQRWELSRLYLDNGLVNEGRGQIWIEDKKAAQALTEQYLNGEIEPSEAYEDGWYFNNQAPPEAQEEAVRETVQREQVSNRRPQRKPKFNKPPDFTQPVAPLIEPPPPPPELRTPQDYAQAYVNVYRANQGEAVNPQLSGRY